MTRELLISGTWDFSLLRLKRGMRRLERPTGLYHPVRVIKLVGTGTYGTVSYVIKCGKQLVQNQ
jgi:hypothetical protein